MHVGRGICARAVYDGVAPRRAGRVLTMYFVEYGVNNKETCGAVRPRRE